ncbi:uncharacterized protein C19orf44 homolog isoform 3-T3 [Discoglossus pictus]
MLPRGGMRNSALARAQAQLSGQRVPLQRKDSTDELKEYMNALNKKTSALKLSHPSVDDLSDVSAEEQETERYKITESPQQAGSTQSRFLKKKPQSNEGTKGSGAKENGPLVSLHNPIKSKMPTSAALKRLAEIETRHRLRRLELDTSENDTDLKISDERPFSARSSSDFSTRGSRFLMKKTNVKDPEPKTQKGKNVVWSNHADGKKMALESEEEEMLHLIGSSVDKSEDSERWWKLPKQHRTPSPPSKGTPRQSLHRSTSALGFHSPRRPPSRFSRTPSPPSQGKSKYRSRTRSLSRLGSRSPSPSVRSSLTNASTPRTRLGRRSHTPRSQRSDLKSLDELFSRTEDLSSASSDDFKLNILSLDELAPTIDMEEKKKKQEHLGKVGKKSKPLTPTKDKTSSKDKKVKLFEQKSASEDESAPEVQTVTNVGSEISEHLHGDPSVSHQGHHKDRDDENTLNSTYSEDFEESVYTTTSEKIEKSKSESSSSTKSTSSIDSSQSPKHHYPPPAQTKQHKKWAEKVQRITLKDTAVQTTGPGFAEHWPHPRSLEQLPGLAIVDPAPVAHHVVSSELIEALTTYSPMALALNDMLKQQLLLTQSFVDMARQLHLSRVTSLEMEEYHYTTLEETKEYIRLQKSLKRKHMLEDEANGHYQSLTKENS